MYTRTGISNSGYSDSAPGLVAFCLLPKRLPASNLSDMRYSVNIKQMPRYSRFPDWHPGATVPFVCTQTGGIERQQPACKKDDTNLFYSMKNPRKSPDNPVGTLTRTMKNAQDDLADLPFFLNPATETPTPNHYDSPAEESFRTFLMNSLPRQKAAPALRERIKKAIKNMPD